MFEYEPYLKDQIRCSYQLASARAWAEKRVPCTFRVPPLNTARTHEQAGSQALARARVARARVPPVRADIGGR